MNKKHEHIYAPNIRCKVCNKTFASIQADKSRRKILKRYAEILNKFKTNWTL